MSNHRWLGVAIAAALCLACSDATVRAGEPEPTTVYVVRHAEAARSAEKRADPPLTERGLAQAADLRDVLASVEIAAVYSTPYRRTTLTAGPTAGTAGLSTMPYRPAAIGAAGGLPDRALLLAKYAGQSVLVVGHSNTVPRIVAHLGGPDDIEIAEDEHDNLFVLELRGATTMLRRHRYGPLATTRRPIVSGEDVGRDVSGVAIVGERIVVCDDEGTHLQELEPSGDEYVAGPPLPLPVSERVTELDLEDLAATEEFVFAVCSHSSVRSAARSHEDSGKPETYRDNRKRLATVTRGSNDERDRLFRVPIDAAGHVQPAQAAALDLRSLLEDEPLLRRAAGVPSKENGIDVEGLAVDGAWLVLGLRGPVLRGNLTPIVRVKPDAGFTKVTKHRVVFVDMEGRGVRGLTRCATGFLVLAGPVGEAPLPFRLYHWDGEDMLPGTRDDDDHSARVGRLTLLGTVPSTAGNSPEGVAIRAESDASWSLLVVYDGPPGGAPVELLVRKLPGL